MASEAARKQQWWEAIALRGTGSNSIIGSQEERNWRQAKWGQGEFKGTILEYENPEKQKLCVWRGLGFGSQSLFLICNHFITHPPTRGERETVAACKSHALGAQDRADTCGSCIWGWKPLTSSQGQRWPSGEKGPKGMSARVTKQGNKRVALLL